MKLGNFGSDLCKDCVKINGGNFLYHFKLYVLSGTLQSLILKILAIMFLFFRSREESVHPYQVCSYNFSGI